MSERAAAIMDAETDRLCPDCGGPALRACAHFEPEESDATTILSNESSLTFYCRACYTRRSYPYRVLRPFGAPKIQDAPVDELPDFPTGARCIYCDAAPAEVLSGADSMFICIGEPSYLSYAGRALCRPCYQWESTLFFARVRQSGIEGLGDVRSIKAEVVREMQCMRLLAPHERQTRKAEADTIHSENPDKVAEVRKLKLEERNREAEAAARRKLQSAAPSSED